MTEPAAPRPRRTRLLDAPLLRAAGRVDTALLRVLRRQGHGNARVENAIRILSRSGEHGAAWIVLGVAGAAVDRPRRGRWLQGLGVVGGTYLLNIAIKQIVRRPRPRLEDLPQLVTTPTQLSFPSAHSATSLAAACVYAPLLAEATGGRCAPRALGAAAAAMVASRLYLGVHYPSDIVAGALLGTVTGRRLRGGVRR